MNGLIEALAEILSIPQTTILLIIIFFVGLLIGYALAKLLKVLLILFIAFFIASYFGIINLNIPDFKTIIEKYGMEIASIAAALLSSTAFVIGAIIGFLIGLFKS
ncbi:MAG: hypothetical protein QXY18_03545 [Nitrososphaerota archaeon]